MYLKCRFLDYPQFQSDLSDGEFSKWLSSDKTFVSSSPSGSFAHENQRAMEIGTSVNLHHPLLSDECLCFFGDPTLLIWCQIPKRTYKGGTFCFKKFKLQIHLKTILQSIDGCGLYLTRAYPSPTSLPCHKLFQNIKEKPLKLLTSYVLLKF